MTNYLHKAREYMDKFSDPARAARALVSDAGRDTVLRDALLLLGAQQAVRNALTSGRSRNNIPVLPSVAGRIARQRWMDTYTLFGGTITLAKATAKDLADSARAHLTQADGHKKSADFEFAVAQRLERTGKTVEQVFTDETVKALKGKKL